MANNLQKKPFLDLRWPQKVRLLRDDFGRLVFLYAARR